MPDPSTAQMKGYLYKKGKFGWDKMWVVLMYDNSLFMSTNETSKKVSAVIPLGPESKVEEKKSTDKKYPHALWLASGKSKETFATDSASDFKLWLTFLKQASGNADIQELLSEDEDAGGGKRGRERERVSEHMAVVYIIVFTQQSSILMPPVLIHCIDTCHYYCQQEFVDFPTL